MREHFLLDPDITFLNHGSFGATPRAVLQAQHEAQLAMERNPVAYLGRASAALLAAARERLAQALGARGDDLVFVPNATTGVNIVARSLALEPGDEILTTDHEYGACIATWRQRCAESGAVLRTVAVPLPFDPGSFARRMLEAITPRTRLVFASHITSTTALVFPLRELCAGAHERGVATLVDGAHAPGQIDLDLAKLGADFYTGNCHKWLCAPKGSAFLHVRPDRRAGPARLEAPVVSWGYVAEQAEADGALETREATASDRAATEEGRSLGHGDPTRLTGGLTSLTSLTSRTGHTGFDAYTGRTPLERRLQWQGTRDISAFLCVPAALDFQAAHDWPAQRRRCHELALALQGEVLARNGLEPIAPDDALAQMVPIPVRTPAEAEHPEALRRWLFEERRIEVPVTQHRGRVFVRVSVQAYNTRADLDRLRDALAEVGA